MYTLVPKRSFLFYVYYEIHFEETCIKTLTGISYEYAKEIVRLLNVAYQLGFGSGYIANNLNK